LTLDQTVEKIPTGTKNISIVQFHPTVPNPGEVPPDESLQKTVPVHYLPYIAIFLDKGNATTQKCLCIKIQVGFQPADILPNRFSIFITLMLKGIMPKKPSVSLP